MSLQRKSIKSWKSAGSDRVPYRSWKRYMKTQVHSMSVRDSILNHIPITGDEVMSSIEGDIFQTATGSVAIEPKVFPQTITCDFCGEAMDLVSVEEWYSCRNELCLLNLSNA